MLLSSDRYEELNQEVVDLMEAYGFASFPMDVFELAGKMGIVLRPYSSIPLAKRSAFLEVSRDAFTIAAGEYETDTTFICYNESANRGRLRQSVAHEIAHIWLEHPSDDEPYETEAEYFAAYLLAPIPLVLKHSNLNIFEVSSAFNISHEAARIAVERAENRMRCRKPFFEYEYTLISMSAVGKGNGLAIA